MTLASLRPRSLEQLRTLELGAVRPLDSTPRKAPSRPQSLFRSGDGPEVRLAARRVSRAPGARHRAAAAPAGARSGDVFPAGVDAGRDWAGHRGRRVAGVAARSLAFALRTRCVRPRSGGECTRKWPRFSIRTRSTRCSVRAAPPTARGGEGQRPSAVRYDFRRPDRVSPANRFARCIYLTIAMRPNLGTSLSAYLRTVTEWDRLGGAVHVPRVPHGAAGSDGLLRDSPCRRSRVAALELNPSIAFTMMDRMLGGSGRGSAGSRPHRDRATSSTRWSS